MGCKSRGAVLLLLTLVSVPAAIVPIWGDGVKDKGGYRYGKEEENCTEKLGEVRDDDEDHGVMPKLIGIFVVLVLFVLVMIIVFGLVCCCRHKKMCCFSRRNHTREEDTPSSFQPATYTPAIPMAMYASPPYSAVDPHSNPADSAYLPVSQTGAPHSQSTNVTTIHTCTAFSCLHKR